MGVHALWNILESSSRPVRLESLSRKRMAVDASIWIYQFLKAVRSAEGGALKASHVVGFFRRICKLLFFGIQPVFVFDGGAPALKREVIRRRKERRQGKREGAEKTAQKLLALQLQRNNQTKENARTEKDHNDSIQYNYIDQGEESSMKHETTRPRAGDDEYDLPQIEGFEFSKNDARFVSEEEYNAHKEHKVDELDGVDLNTIDPASKEFEQLPLTTQYLVLSQLRLRSRLRMGYTKEQLENIFPESMDFSKFQIQMVQKRNYFTQRLMGISGMSDDPSQEFRRIASERDKQYRIQKTEGGWALSLEDDSGTTLMNPVDLEREEKNERAEPLNSDDDDIDWEDVSLESKRVQRVNHSISSLPLPPSANVSAADSTLRSFNFSPSKSKVERPNETDAEEDEDTHYEALNKIEEMELLEAIQKSKDDLKKQQAMERKILEEKKKHHEEDMETLFQDVPFDFDALDEPKELFNSDYPESASGTVLPPPRPIVNQVKQRGPLDRIRAEMDNLLNLTPQSAPPVVSLRGEKEKPSKESKAPTVRIPSSFSEPAVLNSYQQKQKNAIEAKRKADTLKRSDVDIGLFSWGEAQEILQTKNSDNNMIHNADEDEHDDDDDVQIIETPDNMAEASDQPDSSKTIEKELGIPTVRKEDEREAAALDYEFYESDEEQLNEQLEKEELEHEQFQKDLNPQIMAFIDDEEELKKQQRRELRDADEVTVVMIREVQDLLSRFGIPYVTAPMEAEAQCAELLKLGLVDGIITDDSDVFLFGGDRVYRNMFHEKHYVEFYNESALTKVGLDRVKLIELAHLLGSDYTEGLKGIGPVVAMEILANFGGLEQFRDWFLQAQFDLEKQKKETSWQRSLRKKLLKSDFLLDKSFPDKRIDNAYLAAEVDHDRTEFVWGAPDLDRLRSFLMSTVGWSQERVDQVLVPLIRDLNRKKREGTQSTLGEFYDVENMAGVKRKSMNKRMESARKKMMNTKS